MATSAVSSVPYQFEFTPTNEMIVTKTAGVCVKTRFQMATIDTAKCLSLFNIKADKVVALCDGITASFDGNDVMIGCRKTNEVIVHIPRSECNNFIETIYKSLLTRDCQLLKENGIYGLSLSNRIKNNGYITFSFNITKDYRIFIAVSDVAVKTNANTTSIINMYKTGNIVWLLTKSEGSYVMHCVADEYAKYEISHESAEKFIDRLRNY